MITAQNINKSFGESKVLSGVNLHIDKGCIYGLAGRSGAGKSTFLRCINGLEPYDSGTLTVDGVDVKGLEMEELRIFRKNVGMIFQNFSLLERLTVFDNVALPLKCWKYKRSYLDGKVKELLGLVGLSDKIRQKPRTLSGGQKQRVAIARALSLDPRILLCDEATSALDPKTAQEILALLRRINRQMGITIVMVTHQMSVLTSTCDEVAILEDGRLDSKGPVEQIFRQQPLSLKNLLGENEVQAPAYPKSVTISIIAGNELATRMAVDLGVELTIIGERSGATDQAGSVLLLRVFQHDYDNIARYLNDARLAWRTTTPMCSFPEHVSCQAG
jgi:D-methionine transport system ATP-binding protein